MNEREKEMTGNSPPNSHFWPCHWIITAVNMLAISLSLVHQKTMQLNKLTGWSSN